MKPRSRQASRHGRAEGDRPRSRAGRGREQREKPQRSAVRFRKPASDRAGRAPLTRCAESAAGVTRRKPINGSEPCAFTVELVWSLRPTLGFLLSSATVRSRNPLKSASIVARAHSENRTRNLPAHDDRAGNGQTHNKWDQYRRYEPLAKVEFLNVGHGGRPVSWREVKTLCHR
jgi:hypothetical protein